MKVSRNLSKLLVATSVSVVSFSAVNATEQEEINFIEETAATEQEPVVSLYEIEGLDDFEDGANCGCGGGTCNSGCNASCG